MFFMTLRGDGKTSSENIHFAIFVLSGQNVTKEIIPLEKSARPNMYRVMLINFLSFVDTNSCDQSASRKMNVRRVKSISCSSYDSVFEADDCQGNDNPNFQREVDSVGKCVTSTQDAIV